MMQFTVPQFIDVEDKIFGPITVRQFVIMLSGFMVMAVFYKLFDFSLFVTSSLLVFAISGTFAFLKINGMPFHYFVLNFLQTFSRSRLRVWNNSAFVFTTVEEVESSETKITRPVANKMVSTSRLAELSLIVDTQGAYKGGNTGKINAAAARKDTIKYAGF